MTYLAARAPHEELQWRREMLINYLHTVLGPDDTRLQAVIADMRRDICLRARERCGSDDATRPDTTAH